MKYTWSIYELCFKGTITLICKPYFHIAELVDILTRWDIKSADVRTVSIFAAKSLVSFVILERLLADPVLLTMSHEVIEATLKGSSRKFKHPQKRFFHINSFM